MQREQLYHKTVDILVQAYFNDTLIVQDCTACACGNLIAANNGYKSVGVAEDRYWLDKDGDYRQPIWTDAISTSRSSNLFGQTTHKQKLSWEGYTSEVREEIESSGYQLHDFAAIEYAFESGYKGNDKMFNALMKVIEVLDAIHENKDEATTQVSKKKFTKETILS